jgi:hypothetical protein
MKVMKSIKILIYLFVFLYSTHSMAQDYFRNGLGINYSGGFSGVLTDMENMSTITSQSVLVTESMTPIQAHKVSGSVFRYLSKSIGIKLSLGISTNGFNFIGSDPATFTRIKETYKAKTIEFGFSFLGRIPAFNYGNFLIQPGFRLFTDGSGMLEVIFPRQKDAFGITGYFGYEILMFSHNFFSSIGILIDLPIEKHSWGSGENMDYYPYFIGFKVGISYQY